MRVKLSLNIITTILVGIGVQTLVVSCGKPADIPSAPKGAEVYRTVDEKTVLTLRRANEAEISEDGDNYVGTYSEEGSRIRVVMSVLGTQQALYFDRIPDGLKNDKGDVLYNSKRYPEVMKQIMAKRHQAELDQLLREAARGSPKDVSDLLSRGANINAVDARGNTPLHNAAMYSYDNGSHTQILQMLVGKGANLNALDRQGETPLMVAVRHDNYESIRFLVAAGAERGKGAWALADDDKAAAALRTPAEEGRFQEKMALFRKLIVNRWRWANSVALYLADGTYEEIYDDGKRVTGSWTIDNHKFYLQERRRDGYHSARELEFFIADLSPAKCTLKNRDGAATASVIDSNTLAQLNKEYPKLMARKWRWNDATHEYRTDGTFSILHDSGKTSLGRWRIEDMRLYLETGLNEKYGRQNKSEYFIEKMTAQEFILSDGDNRIVGTAVDPQIMADRIEALKKVILKVWESRMYNNELLRFYADGHYERVYPRSQHFSSGTWRIIDGPRLVMEQRMNNGSPVQSRDGRGRDVDYFEESFYIADIKEDSMTLTDKSSGSQIWHVSSEPIPSLPLSNESARDRRTGRTIETKTDAASVSGASESDNPMFGTWKGSYKGMAGLFKVTEVEIQITISSMHAPVVRQCTVSGTNTTNNHNIIKMNDESLTAEYRYGNGNQSHIMIFSVDRKDKDRGYSVEYDSNRDNIRNCIELQRVKSAENVEAATP